MEFRCKDISDPQPDNHRIYVYTQIGETEDAVTGKGWLLRKEIRTLEMDGLEKKWWPTRLTPDGITKTSVNMRSLYQIQINQKVQELLRQVRH